MKKIFVFTALCLLAIGIVQCTKVPVTGRSQLTLIPEAEMIQMSNEQYKQFLSQSRLCTDQAKVAMVYKVAGRIQTAVEQYLTQNNASNRLNGFVWEFNVVESNEINAWCMPGGKVVVYTGILPVCQSEEGLAVVLGHEIAHAVARHGNERMSHEMIAQFGMSGLNLATHKSDPQTQAIFNKVFGIGANVGVLLPYSRKHESEADHLGLIFMAMAGYNPQTAIGFWERMAASGGQKPPEFLSTHPSDQTRIRDLEKEMPQAMKYYKPQ